ncbi:MAG: FtsQ-type POTRA domain-containing protein [Solirubrobacteraceae bacterium]
MIGIRRRRPEPAPSFGWDREAVFADDVAFGRDRAQRRWRRPRLGPLLLVCVLLFAGLLVGGYFWVRSSPLSAVRNVKVVGLSGAETGQIRDALESTARGMSTLNVSTGKFHNAVAAYPEVKSVKASVSFPHSMTIKVVEQDPVAVVVAGGHRTVVSGDGTLLPNVTASSSLPTITGTVAPGGTTLSGAPLQEAELLADAPYALLSRITTTTESPTHGLTAALRDGPQLYFGGSGQLAAKWNSAVAVLANASSAGAAYIDVTDPSRPAAGP